ALKSSLQCNGIIGGALRPGRMLSAVPQNEACRAFRVSAPRALSCLDRFPVSCLASQARCGLPDVYTLGLTWRALRAFVDGEREIVHSPCLCQCAVRAIRDILYPASTKCFTFVSEALASERHHHCASVPPRRQQTNSGTLA